MKKTYFSPLRFKWLIIFFIIINFSSQSQVTISYPVAAQSVTASFGNNRLLTVRLDFVLGSASGANVTVTLPAGITYVSGSVVALTGATNTSTGLTITNSGGTASVPQFLVGPNSIAINSFITFKIAREADCSARDLFSSGTVFKDQVSVSTSAGTKTDNIQSVNNYVIDFPALFLGQPIAQTNAIKGSTYSRTFTIVNGGAGCTDEVYFSIEYPLAGINRLSLTLASVSGAIVLTPSSTVGNISNFTVQSINLPGGDLCNGETLTFTETYKPIICNPNTNYTAGWGLNANSSTWCETLTGSGSVTMATGVPNVVPTAEAVISKFEFCTGGKFTVTFTNNGNGLSGSATAFSIKSKLGAFFTGVSPGFSAYFGINDIKIGGCSGTLLTQTGGVAVASYQYNSPVIVDLSQLTTAIDGLTDEDADGQFDDLKVGQSFTLCYRLYTIPYSVGTCSVDYRAAFSQYQSEFKDSCNSLINGQLFGVADVPGEGAGVDLVVNATPVNIVPTDVIDNTPIPIKITLSGRSGLGYPSMGCDSGFMRLKFNVPVGYSLDPGFAAKFDGIVGTLISATQPSSATIIVDVKSTNQNLFYYNSVFDFNFRFTCPSVNAPITYTVDWMCDAAGTCSNRLSCSTFNLTNHCPVPCSGGLTITNSDFERTTLGFTDGTGATRVNKTVLSASDLNTATVCDEVRGTFTGKYISYSGTPNGKFELVYDLAGSNKILEYVPGSAKFQINSGTLCSAISLSETVAGGKHTIIFNLNSCATSTLINNDLVKLIADFKILDNASLPTVPTQLPGVVALYYSLDSSNNKISCDSFGGELRLHRTPINNLYSNEGTLNYTGCANPSLATGLYYTPLENLYSNEVRPPQVTNFFKLKLNNGFELDTTVAPRIIVYGASQTGQNYPVNIDATPFITIAANEVIFTNDGSWPLPDFSGNGLTYLFTYKLKSTCASLSTGTFVYNAEGTNFSRNAFQAGCGTPLTGAATGPRTTTVNFAKPVVQITNQSGAIQASKPTESFIIRFTNISTSPAPYNWIAIPTYPGVTATQIIDLATNTAISPLSYVGGSWFKLSTAGVATGVTKDYRIDFNYNNCTTTSFPIEAGWDCASYPINPTSYSCTKQNLVLTFTPLEAEVQIQPVVQPSGNYNYCTTQDYQFDVVNAQAANVSQSLFTVTLPTGLALVSNSFQVEYPKNSNNWQTVPVTILGTNVYKYNLAAHPAYPTLNGIPGTSQTAINNNRIISVRFKTNAACGYVAGAKFQISTSAISSCGTFADGSNINLFTMIKNKFKKDSIFYFAKYNAWAYNKSQIFDYKYIFMI